MTYQHTSEQFAVRIPARGQSTSTAPFLNARRAVELLGNVFDGLLARIDRAAEASSRRKQIKALEAKSDAELADMGIRRDQFARNVFRNLNDV